MKTENMISETAQTANSSIAARAGIQLTTSQLIHVGSAELWLKLGEPTSAIAELEVLPQPTLKSARVLKAWLSALNAAREKEQL